MRHLDGPCDDREMETKLKQEPVADGMSTGDAAETMTVEFLASDSPQINTFTKTFIAKHSLSPKVEPVADGGGGMPELPATTDPFETLRNTARWCMAASQQDWEDDLIDIKTAASGAPKTILALFAQLASSREALRAALTLLRKFIPACGCALGDCNNCTEAKALLSPEGGSR